MLAQWYCHRSLEGVIAFLIRPQAKVQVMNETGDTADGTAEGEDGRSYRGVLGTFPYAFRQSRSRLFRAYAVVGGLAAVLVTIAFILAVVVIIGATADTTATLALSRSFVVFLGILVVVPILAPVLFVARRHRRKTGDDVRYDRRLAATGFVFLASLYVGLIPTVPAEHQSDVDGVFGPVITFLYDLPAAVGLAFPILTAALIYVVHRQSR